MNHPGLGQTQQTDKRAQGEAVYGAIVRNAKRWAPDWVGKRPGEHPRLPVKPPKAMVT